MKNQLIFGQKASRIFCMRNENENENGNENFSRIRMRMRMEIIFFQE
jgi:hypothetical protein